MRHFGFFVMATGLILLVGTVSARAEDAAGDWTGQLPSGFVVRLHIDRATDGFSGAFINASGNRTQLDKVTSDGAGLHFQIDNSNLSYDGIWAEDRSAWQGTLVLQGNYPLSLHRATAVELGPKVRRRPQETAIEAGPRPYSEHNVNFENSSAKVNLAGTLTLPQGKGPFPAVVLVSGTGPNTRDEEAEGHKVFTVLADALARRGIAVLRYDKRGVGESTGSYVGTTTIEFASDARAAIAFLKAQPGINSNYVGILGHSEGGIIAPMVGVDVPDIAFVVILGGPSIRGDKLFLAQSEKVSSLYGVPKDYIMRRKAFDRKLYEAVMSAGSDEEATTKAREIITQGVLDKVVDANEAPTLTRDTTTAWERFFLAYDPAPTLRQLSMPVLAVYGSLDSQVPAEANLPVAREALKNNKSATVIELPGLNHLLQQATTGSPQEYADIDETMSLLALNTVVDWIVESENANKNKAH